MSVCCKDTGLLPINGYLPVMNVSRVKDRLPGSKTGMLVIQYTCLLWRFSFLVLSTHVGAFGMRSVYIVLSHCGTSATFQISPSDSKKDQINRCPYFERVILLNFSGVTPARVEDVISEWPHCSVLTLNQCDEQMALLCNVIASK